MTRTARDIAEQLNLRLIGEGGVPLDDIGDIQSAGPRDLVFSEDEKSFARAVASGAGAIIAPESAAKAPCSKPLLIAALPRLAFARAAVLLVSASQNQPGIHPTAVVHPSTHLDASVSVGAHVTIEANASIAERTSIAAGSVIGSGVKIGSDCRIHPNVTIYPGATLGDRVVVHAGAVLGADGFGYVRDHSTGRYEKFPQMGTLEIADDVEIGANATIDRGALAATRIGRGVKIDNLVHIAHNVEVGDDVVIAAQTGVSGSAVIEPGVVIAGQVGIADHVRIESGAILGAQSGIPSKKVIRGKGVVFWGTPARPIKEYLKELATLARLTRKG